MSLTSAFLDELRARTLLSGLIGKTVKLQKAGREFRACCPFHNEKTPSFYVNDDKGFYHCFGCGTHGDAIRWMTDQRGLPFIDAVKELAQAAGLDMPEQDRRAAEKAERAKGLHEAMADAAAWFAERLSGIEGAEARSVLKRRGISEETARTFGLGFAPDSRGKLKEALKAYGDAMLVEAGMLIQVDEKTPYDRFRGRLMIPIRDVRGRTIAFGGRIIGEGEPKYLNSPETPLFDKGRTLYNLDRAQAAARKADRIIAVEGYMDVIALAQAGFDETVAPLGTALTEHQLERLWRISEVPLLCFDGDTAGQKAALRAAHRALPMLQPGRSLAFVTLPEGLDPDDVVRTKGATAFKQLLENPQALVNLLWESELKAAPLNTPEERAGLGARLRSLAREIKNEDVRSQYLATFNRMVWDYFHPERPSKAFSKFGKVKELFRGPRDRLMAIRDHGIAQATFVPAMMHGFFRHPNLIAPMAETFAGVGMNSIPLRQVRGHMLDAALANPKLTSSDLREILRADALEPILQKIERVTLAFSFLVSGTKPEQAAKDLSAVVDALFATPRLDEEVDRLRERWKDGFDERDYQAYERVLKHKHDVEEAFKLATMPENGDLEYAD